MHEPIRVAMLTQSYLPRVGGAERQIAELAPLMQRLGVELHLVTRRYPELAPHEVIGGVPVHRLPVPGPKPVAAAAFALAALPLLRRLRPDVVHAFALFSPTTTALVAKRLFGAPVVVKVLRGGTHGDVAKLRAGPLGDARMAVVRREVDAFITISKEIDEELAGAGVPAERRPFIPNGVDTERFAPPSAAERTALRRSLGLDSGPIAVFTGRLNAEKNVGQLVDLWPDMRARHSDATLLLVGTGYQEAELRARAGPGIRFAGRVDDVAPYLRAADIFVLPSAAEGLSNALLEAMAAGLPPVVTAVGGATDLVEHGRNGHLVAPNDRAALRAALLEILGDADLRERLGRLARERIVCDYRLPSIALRLRDLYDAVRRREPLASPGSAPVTPGE